MSHRISIGVFLRTGPIGVSQEVHFSSQKQTYANLRDIIKYLFNNLFSVPYKYITNSTKE